MVAEGVSVMSGTPLLMERTSIHTTATEKHLSNHGDLIVNETHTVAIDEGKWPTDYRVETQGPSK